MDEGGSKSTWIGAVAICVAALLVAATMFFDPRRLAFDSKHGGVGKRCCDCGSSDRRTLGVPVAADRFAWAKDSVGRVLRDALRSAVSSGGRLGCRFWETRLVFVRSRFRGGANSGWLASRDLDSRCRGDSLGDLDYRTWTMAGGTGTRRNGAPGRSCVLGIYQGDRPSNVAFRCRGCPLDSSDGRDGDDRDRSLSSENVCRGDLYRRSFRWGNRHARTASPDGGSDGVAGQHARGDHFVVAIERRSA